MRPTPVWRFDELLSYIPKNGFIYDYVKYGVACTDAPPMYHILTASSLVSAAVSPYLDLVFEDHLHPLHMFFLLIGDSASRKTSAITRGVNVATPPFQAMSQRGDRLWYIATSSPEGVLEELAKEPNRLMILPEWTQLHGMGAAKYWAHAPEFINQLYDATELHRSRAKVHMVIQRPRVSIIGASTPSLIEYAVRRVDWLGGKMARYVIGCASRPLNVEMAAPVELPQAVAALRGRLRELVGPTSTGQARLSKEAWQMMLEWRRGKPWREQVENAPEHLAPSYGRAQEHVFRLATIYQASISYPYPVVVEPAVMHAAIEMIWWCYESLTHTVLVNEDRKPPLERIASVLVAAGGKGMTRSDLLKRVQVKARELDDVLSTLNERGTLEQRMERYKGAGRPRVRYIFRDSIADA